MSSPAVIYILSNVNGHCPRTWTKGVKEIYTTAEFKCLVFFFFFPFPILVVDLGDSSFAAPTFDQLVDGALAVALEFIQVLVEDLAGTQC